MYIAEAICALRRNGGVNLWYYNRFAKFPRLLKWANGDVVEWLALDLCTLHLDGARRASEWGDEFETLRTFYAAMIDQFSWEASCWHCFLMEFCSLRHSDGSFLLTAGNELLSNHSQT